LQHELRRLILRRTRVALCLGIATVTTFVIANHASSPGPPRWTDVLNLVTLLLIGIAFAASKVPFVERRPIPFALLIFAVGCSLRSLSGIWHGDVVPTALLLGGLTLVTAATIPWGLFAQMTIALVAGGAIGLNSYLVLGNFGPPPWQPAVSVALMLVASVVVAVELHRHRIQMLVDNLRRREAEASLADLNAELEQRVIQRTAELATTTQRLEREFQEHQAAVAQLRESERRLQEVLDHALAAIYLRDAEGRYLLINRRWEEVAGRPAAEVVGKKIDDIMPAELAEVLIAHDREVLVSGKSLLFEEVAPLEDGLHTYISVKFPQFDSDGQPVGVWGISTDITEQKHAEERARQHQAELAHVLRLSTMGEMAAGLAHEINQPLGAVTNYARGSVRRLRDRSMSSAELLPVMEAIAREALRAGDIIRRVRDLVRKEATEQAAVDLNALVRDAARFVDGEAHHSAIGVQLVLAPALPPVVCNGVQIEQVMLNLLRNATEAVQASGGNSVTVTTAASRGDTVEVTVCDDGVGLPESSADVFAPFYSTKATGLGMGLSISRSIIEAHRGQLWATRNADRGSTFHFTLPVGDAGDGAEHSAPPAMRAASRA